MSPLDLSLPNVDSTLFEPPSRARLAGGTSTAHAPRILAHATRPKGVMSSYLHAHATGKSWDFINEDDRQLVPRHVRMVDELPRKPTQKVQKHLIRALGVDGATWGREQAGAVLRRQRL